MPYVKKSFKTTWFLKKREKKNLRKIGLPVKSEYIENRGISETSFPDSFLKLNYLQVYVKKKTFRRFVMSKSLISIIYYLKSQI
jgi:hypothetical protein